MLKVKQLEKCFGKLQVLKNCNLEVKENTIRGLIGPNGAGKTTLINVINGFLKPDHGEIFFKNERIDGLKANRIARKGIGRTFQITRLFDKMTVMENMIVAGFNQYKNTEDIRREAIQKLEMFDLCRLKDEYAINLSGGQKKLLELARTLIFEPELILLDEPFHGIHPNFKKKIVDSVKALSKKGKTFLIVSHDIPSIVNACDLISVLCAGEAIAEGTGEEIRNNQKVIEAYLGV